MIPTHYIIKNLVNPVWHAPMEEVFSRPTSPVLGYFKTLEENFGSRWFRSIDCRNELGGTMTRHCFLLGDLHARGLVRKRIFTRYAGAGHDAYEYQICAILI